MTTCTCVGHCAWNCPTHAELTRDDQLRQYALTQAINNKAYTGGMSMGPARTAAAVIVSDAEQFYQFLQGVPALRESATLDTIDH